MPQATGAKRMIAFARRAIMFIVSVVKLPFDRYGQMQATDALALRNRSNGDELALENNTERDRKSHSPACHLCFGGARNYGVAIFDGRRG